MSGPEEYVNRVEETKKSKAPSDGIDDDLLTSGSELEDHGAEKKQVDKGPDPKGPLRGGNVGHLSVSAVVELPCFGGTHLFRPIHRGGPRDPIDV